MNNNIIPEMAVVGNRCIAAILSSARSEWGKYFSVVESPRLGRRDFQNEVIRRSNLFNICEFDTLFQADLPSNARYELNKNFSPSQVRVVQPLDQILRPNSDKPSLRFRSDNAIEALFQSLRTNQILEVDEAAPSLTISNDFDSEVLVLVEDTEEVGSVVAVNLASYLCAHLKKLPRKSRESVQITDGLYRRFEEEVNYSRKTCIEEQISANLGIDISEFELSHYSYCIIFTSGLLYGAAIKQVPTGHFLVYPDCGLHVLRNIAFSPRLRTALLIDPCSLSHPETADVATNLAERGVYVRILTGKDANAVKVDFSVRELPFDWVIFVAHGGFPKGYRLKVNFSDPNGNEHLLVIRKIDSFTVIHDSDKIRVASFVEPESIDGVLWDNLAKSIPDGTYTVISDLAEATKSGFAKVVDTEAGVEMRFSNCMKLAEGNYFPAFDAFGSELGPVVINNTCNSAHNLGSLFLFGGARIYIGTLYNVLDSIASEFMKGLVRTDLSLGEYVKIFNNSHFSDNYLSCYIIFGLPTHRVRVDCNENERFYYSEVEHRLKRQIEFKDSNPFHETLETVEITIARLERELTDIG